MVEKVQYNAFVTRSRGLFEEDRPIFTLLVALEIEDSLGRIAIGEREFLISPPFGASIKQLAYPKWEIPPKTLAKKPFDWMLDEQYHNLQVRWLTDIYSHVQGVILLLPTVNEEIMLYYIIVYHNILYYIISHYVIFCYTMLCYIILYYIILYYIIL